MRFAKVTAVVAAGLALGASAALGQEADGKALYETHCVKCHGTDGVPPEILASRFKNLKPLSDPAIYEGVSVDSTVAVLENGIGVMKSYKGTLDHAQEVAIAEYIRTLVKTGAQDAVLPAERAPKPASRDPEKP